MSGEARLGVLVRGRPACGLPAWRACVAGGRCRVEEGSMHRGLSR